MPEFKTTGIECKELLDQLGRCRDKLFNWAAETFETTDNPNEAAVDLVQLLGEDGEILVNLASFLDDQRSSKIASLDNSSSASSR